VAVAITAPVLLVLAVPLAPVDAAVDNGVCQTTAVVADLFGVVTRIDVPTGQALADPLDLGDGANPSDLAMTPDGATVVVTDGGRNELVRIDLATWSVTGSTTVGQSPTQVAITPDGATAVVTNATDGTVSTVDIATMTRDPADIAVGAMPYGVAITPDGSTAYVANNASGSVSTIDLATRTTDPVDIPVGLGAYAVAITPDGSTAFVTKRPELADPPPAVQGTISTIDIVTRTKDPVDLDDAARPAGIAISPDGRTAYVAQSNADAVATIDVTTRSWGATSIPVDSYPDGLAITSDGKQVYSSNLDDQSVSPIDAVDGTYSTDDGITVGAFPTRVAFTPCPIPPPPVTTTTTRPAPPTTSVPTPSPVPAVAVVADPRLAG
jgi:YVTN family beta-propeller protein